MDDLLGYHEKKDGNSSVVVALRIRPLSIKEGETNECLRAEEVVEDGLIYEPIRRASCQTARLLGDNTHDEMGQVFTFDHVFSPLTNQVDFYNTCVDSLTQSCLDGYNGTIFAYGQTGSGKTHTIMGGMDDIVDGLDDQAGVIPRSLRKVFDGLEKKLKSFEEQIQDESLSTLPRFEYQLKVQFMELYGEEIYDLLIADENLSQPTSPRKRKEKAFKNQATLRIRDGNVGEDAEVLGLCQSEVSSVEEALKYLQCGLKKRRTESTAMNEVSSRSHAIYTLIIKQTERKAPVPAMAGMNLRKGAVEMKTSNFHFVDLAGSERLTRTKAEGERMKEGININKGLFVLGKVISALCSEETGKYVHIPYRESKLTRLLKGSLGGNHKTLMIACASPAFCNRGETLNTLQYATRAKNIKNKAKVNIDPASRVIYELRDQNAALAKELLRIYNIAHFDNSGCQFSEDFLDALLRAGGTHAKLENQLPPRPFTSPHQISQNQAQTKPLMSPVDNKHLLLQSLPILRRSYSDGDLYQLRNKSIENSSEIKEDQKRDNGISGFDQTCKSEQNSLYDLMPTPKCQLKAISCDEDSIDKEANDECTKLGDDHFFDKSNEFNERCESEQNSLYDLMLTSERELKAITNSDDGTRKEIHDEYMESGDDHFSDKRSQLMSRRTSLHDSLDIGKKDDPQNVNKVNKSFIGEDEQIELYDSVGSSLRRILKAVTSADDKVCYDHSHDKLGTILDEYEETGDEVRSNNSESSPTPATTVDLNIVKLDTILDQYEIHFQALQLENDINVVNTKIENFTKQKKFLHGIRNHLEKRPLDCNEVERCIVETEEEIIILEKERDKLLGLIKMKSVSTFRTTNGHRFSMKSVNTSTQSNDGIKETLGDVSFPSLLSLSNSCHDGSHDYSSTSCSGVSFEQSKTTFDQTSLNDVINEIDSISGQCTNEIEISDIRRGQYQNNFDLSHRRRGQCQNNIEKSDKRRGQSQKNVKERERTRRRRGQCQNIVKETERRGDHFSCEALNTFHLAFETLSPSEWEPVLDTIFIP